MTSDPTKPLCVFLLLMSLAGCTGTSAEPSLQPVSLPQPSVKQLQDEWYNAYTRDTNAETSRMYDCLSEIWERAAAGKSPAGGTACREACAMKAAINAKVDSAPAYISDAESFRLKEVSHSPCSKRRSHD